MGDTLTDSVLEEAGSSISRRTAFWFKAAQMFGVPTVALGFIGWGAWIASGKFWEDAVKPVVASHVKTLDTLAEASKRNAESLDSLQKSHVEQRDLLQKINATQQDIRSVLQQGLKIQESTAAQHQEPPQPGPSGTEPHE